MNQVRRLLVAGAAVVLATPAFAQDTSNAIRITGIYGLGGRPGVAVLPIAGSTGDSLRAILQRDLDFGDRVTILGANAEDLPLVSGVPSAEAFGIFARIGAVYVVQGSVTPGNELHIAVYDVAKKNVLNAANYPLDEKALSPDWRMDVHRASDATERWLTGVAGIAATRIAFQRGGQLWMVDSDGANAAPVAGTGGGQQPAWDPTGRYIAFSTIPTSDAGGISIRDTWTGSTRRLTPSVRSGTFTSPAFTPDGAMIAYGFGVENTDIMLVDVKGGTPRSLTVGRRLNTSPSFSRDGRQFVFMSDRLGPPDVYIADIDGSNAHPLTLEGFSERTYRSSPSWSPDGRMIAYQSDIGGRFQIVQSAPNGSGTQALTSEGENEDPFWASDSRHLVFTSTRTGSAQLWVLDTQSGRARQLTRGPQVKNGAWSPPLARR